MNSQQVLKNTANSQSELDQQILNNFENQGLDTAAGIKSLLQQCVSKVWALRGDIAQAVIGCFWIGVLTCFIMFIYDYNRLYYYGKVKRIKKYEMSYNQLERHARRIVLGFILFLGLSLSLFAIDEQYFIDTIKKGFALALFVVPMTFQHYGNEEKY